jgi:hypothetical protein
MPNPTTSRKAKPLIPCQRENRGGSRPGAGRKKKPLPQGQSTLSGLGTVICPPTTATAGNVAGLPPRKTDTIESTALNELRTSNFRTIARDNNGTTSTASSTG